MEYLKGTANASASAIQLICRYLAEAGAPLSGSEIRSALRPLPKHRLVDAQPKSSDLLASSLKVAAGVGMIHEQTNDVWTVNPVIARGFETADEDEIAWFHSELLRRMNAEAMSALVKRQKPPDLVLGMAWFLQQNPLKPLGILFSQGAETSIAKLAHADGTLVKAVENQEQWRSFVRWLLALGLARNVEVKGSKVVVADASTAIADSLGQLPMRDRAEQWLTELRSQLPIFGAKTLLAALPAQRTGWNEIPPAVSLGLLKLEKRGILKMESADDGRGVVAVGLGGNTRQVGFITVTGAVA